MKILVFSDSHLSKKFDEQKFNFLKRIISSSDKVTINGDFWEGYEITFDQFIDSTWNKLFPLLLKKDAVYIYGNHDKQEYSDSRVKLFCIKATKKYSFKSGNKTFYLEHGDRITPFFDRFFKRFPVWSQTILTILENLSVKLTGMRAIRLVYDRFNKQIIKKVARNLKSNEYLICGHTSVAMAALKDHYLNSGWIKHGIAQYLIIEDGKVTAFSGRY